MNYNRIDEVIKKKDMKINRVMSEYLRLSGKKLDRRRLKAIRDNDAQPYLDEIATFAELLGVQYHELLSLNKVKTES